MLVSKTHKSPKLYDKATSLVIYALYVRERKIKINFIEFNE